ncbi:MAG TPA: cell division protein FtsZ [Crocinitomix sp.]|nr:cell division protein FtsZ [Crocinitomix sp.]
MEFDLPKDQSSIIKVIGVGGGGGNAVTHMYNEGIKGVDFIICNTDQQALDVSPVPNKIQLGASLTEGRGAGAIPEIGKNAAIENIDDIKEILSKNTKMVFITAGMGGGTGTGAAPVIAKVAKEMGILTVGIVTIPFTFEGRKRKTQAEKGLEELKQNVDTIIVINNDKLREMFGNLTLGNAFAKADDVLATAAKGIAELISVTGNINVDFNDVSTVMRNSGAAIMGSATAEGENRALEATSNALTSPLLNDNNIEGATHVLLNITHGGNMSMDEMTEITDYIQEEAGSTAEVIFGLTEDENMGDAVNVTLIATGFQTNPLTGLDKEPEKTVHKLEDTELKAIVTPIESPTEDKQWTTPIENTEEKTIKEEIEEEPFLKVTEETPAQTEINWSFDDKIEDTKEEDVTSDVKKEKEIIRHYLTDDVEEKTELENNATVKPVLSQEEQQKRATERMERIQEYTQKLKNPNGLSELEKEPAYKRRDIKFENTQHSSEDVKESRFTLGKTGENGQIKIELKSNNSFLHDNVD